MSGSKCVSALFDFVGLCKHSQIPTCSLTRPPKPSFCLSSLPLPPWETKERSVALPNLHLGALSQTPSQTYAHTLLSPARHIFFVPSFVFFYIFSLLCMRLDTQVCTYCTVCKKAGLIQLFGLCLNRLASFSQQLEFISSRMY